jgi:hypothetical protein
MIAGKRVSVGADVDATVRAIKMVKRAPITACVNGAQSGL